MMAKREKKPVHHVVMTDGKRQIIGCKGRVEKARTSFFGKRFLSANKSLFSCL